MRFTNDAVVADSGLPDPTAWDAWQHDPCDLPVSTLQFLLASRYCEVDSELMQFAWNQFGNTPMGWGRVQAICDFVHNHLRFDYQNARATRTALDGFREKTGVCRDFTHLAITLCRCMNIPARYCTGYLGDIGIPPVPYPMDFSAWFEVFLGDRWHTFDARHNTPRIGRIVMARGRDASDVPITMAFGQNTLEALRGDHLRGRPRLTLRARDAAPRAKPLGRSAVSPGGTPRAYTGPIPPLMPRSRAAARIVSTTDSFESVPVLTQAVGSRPRRTAARRIHLIGGEKGGVGKSVVARLLAQHFIDHNLAFTGFDTDRSHGALMRFYKDYASPVLVDRFEALDAIVESAIEHPGQRVLVDLAAQTHDPLVRWMDESGVLELAAESGVQIHYWHVMDAGRDSVDLLERLIDRFEDRLQYVLVLNELRGDDFGNLERSGQFERAKALGARVVHLKHLQDAVLRKIDATDSSFWAARTMASNEGPKLGLLERQRLKMWLAHAAAEIAAAGV